MNAKIIDSGKGSFCFHHVLPVQKRLGMDLQAQLAPLEQLKRNAPDDLHLGDEVYGDLFGGRFLAIDRFLQESVTYSFTLDDAEALQAALAHLQQSASEHPPTGQSVR